MMTIMTASPKTLSATGNKIAYIMGKSKRVARMAKSLKSEREDFIIFVNKYRRRKIFAMPSAKGPKEPLSSRCPL